MNEKDMDEFCELFKMELDEWQKLILRAIIETEQLDTPIKHLLSDTNRELNK